MQDFGRNSQLNPLEAAMWSRKHELIETFCDRPEDLDSITLRAFTWMGFKIYAAVLHERAEHEKAEVKDTENTEKVTDNNLFFNAVAAESIDRELTVEQLDMFRFDFCDYCWKSGHRENSCRELMPEEDCSNFCGICDRIGHTEETCFQLYPELRAKLKLAAKKSNQKLICTHCNRSGHIRRFCWKLHPEQRHI